MAELDKIVLEGLEFHARHGVFEAESAFGSRFVVDVEFYVRITGTDTLSETVDYSAVYDLVRARVTETRFSLIEALAHSLAEALLRAQPSAAVVVVRVHKPHAPLPGVFRDVYAEVRRDRKEL
ncbi:MAG: Dihydroneopterin aldolase [uncultured Truepera sp.]|uniref:7,8-dihydroneopterin aldolase n=1 Tax=uncultured Truepera sp. TaxID=543023 RepID=A0A6J4VTY9_9DEIN|nr:MAG: Dihydroneopterin aldolase [uncultured Truepera sp.]